MIIGFTGPAGSGKSTAAKYLATHRGYMRISFAGPLKAMTRALLSEAGVSLEDTHYMTNGHLKESEHAALSGKSARYAMQTLGTEWGRECIHSDFWVNIACQRIMSEFEVWSPNIVIDDVRFENEASMIRGFGGTIIHLSGRGGLTGSHESENGVENMAPYDVAIRNDGTLPAFYSELMEWVA